VSILDEWVSGFNAAAAAVGGVVMTAITTFFITRGKYSKLQKEIAADRADTKKIDLEAGWVERLVKDNHEKDDRIESLHTSQLNDARHIARVETEALACRERMSEAKIERDMAIEQMHQLQSRVAASEERVIALRDEVLDLKLANGRLLKELAALNTEAAERVLQLHLKPAHKPRPSLPGDEVT
jgi:hypothetical protein